MYVEERYQTLDSRSGLTHAAGVNLTPLDHWNFGANADFGTLVDRDTGADTKRKAGGLRIGYGLDKISLSTGLEYRFDQTQLLTGGWSDRTSYLIRNNLKYEITPSWRVIGKMNYSASNSSLGSVYDGGYTEGVLGWAYRPVDNDRLNVLAKYTFFYNVPAVDQLTPNNVSTSPSTQFLQKSHIASIDVTYDLLTDLTVGAKYAYRLGEASLDRQNPQFFQNNAHLYVLQTSYKFLHSWEATAEYRLLDLPDISDRRGGATIGVYRYIGDHTKLGVGYNFSDFSDDLTDLSFSSHGFFVNFNVSM
jgi:hypothetical protein